LRHRFQITGGFDRQAGQAPIGQTWDQVGQGGPIVAQGVGRGQQQLVWRDLVQDVGHFHDVDVAHEVSKSSCASQHASVA
jgi:hypothetical protein